MSQEALAQCHVNCIPQDRVPGQGQTLSQFWQARLHIFHARAAKVLHYIGASASNKCEIRVPKCRGNKLQGRLGADVRQLKGV